MILYNSESDVAAARRIVHMRPPAGRGACSAVDKDARYRLPYGDLRLQQIRRPADADSYDPAAVARVFLWVWGVVLLVVAVVGFLVI